MNKMYNTYKTDDMYNTNNMIIRVGQILGFLSVIL